MTDNTHIQIFQSADGSVRLDIKLERETLWLTQLQMSELFATTPENVLMHLNNIYNDQELEQERTTKDFLVVREEGKRQVQRSLKHYSLDAIISVGYRVSSARATQFRIWATHTLKQHLVQGYTLNQQRLKERGIELEQAIAFYRALIQNESAVRELGDNNLRELAKYVTTQLRKSTTVDWQVRDSVRARLRNLVRRALRKWKYPPDKADEAIELCLKQAEALSQSWSY
jgi:hypothetical protein